MNCAKHALLLYVFFKSRGVIKEETVEAGWPSGRALDSGA